MLVACSVCYVALATGSCGDVKLWHAYLEVRTANNQCQSIISALPIHSSSLPVAVMIRTSEHGECRDWDELVAKKLTSVETAKPNAWMCFPFHHRLEQ